MTLQQFAAIVRTLRGGEALSDDTLLEMFEDALDASNQLLNNSSSDVIVLQGFLCACRKQGIPATTSTTYSN